MRTLKSHPLLKMVNSYVIDSPQPSNIINFASLLALGLIIGVTLGMHYTPNVLEAFDSVQHIMRDVNNGWLIRYLHSNTASAFFFLVYLHIGRGLYCGSFIVGMSIPFFDINIKKKICDIFFFLALIIAFIIACFFLNLLYLSNLIDVIEYNDYVSRKKGIGKLHYLMYIPVFFSIMPKKMVNCSIQERYLYFWKNCKFIWISKLSLKLYKYHNLKHIPYPPFPKLDMKEYNMFVLLILGFLIYISFWYIILEFTSFSYYPNLNNNSIVYMYNTTNNISGSGFGLNHGSGSGSGPNPSGGGNNHHNLNLNTDLDNNRRTRPKSPLTNFSNSLLTMKHQTINSDFPPFKLSPSIKPVSSLCTIPKIIVPTVNGADYNFGEEWKNLKSQEFYYIRGYKKEIINNNYVALLADRSINAKEQLEFWNQGKLSGGCFEYIKPTDVYNREEVYVYRLPNNPYVIRVILSNNIWGVMVPDLSEPEDSGRMIFLDIRGSRIVSERFEKTVNSIFDFR